MGGWGEKQKQKTKDSEDTLRLLCFQAFTGTHTDAGDPCSDHRGGIHPSMVTEDHPSLSVQIPPTNPFILLSLPSPTITSPSCHRCHRPPDTVFFGFRIFFLLSFPSPLSLSVCLCSLCHLILLTVMDTLECTTKALACAAADIPIVRPEWLITLVHLYRKRQPFDCPVTLRFAPLPGPDITYPLQLKSANLCSVSVRPRDRIHPRFIIIIFSFIGFPLHNVFADECCSTSSLLSPLLSSLQLSC